MPELPEVEATRFIVEKAMKKKKIIAVKADPSRLFDRDSAASFKKKITGGTVTGSDRRGKYFWLKLNQKPWPIFHLGMTGSFEIYKSEKELPKKTPRSVRVEFKLNDGSIVWFKDPRMFGRVRMSDDPLKEKSIAALGFDPLFEFPTAKALHEILLKRKTPIKALLLDQSIFAGVGNWIADEVLFQSKLSPFRSARSITLKEATTLRANILKVIKKAVSVSANADDFPKNWLFHHRWGRAKDAVVNGHRIQHVTIGGRTAAWVPELQK